MAAYAALVSVMNIIEQLENHPRPPVSLDKKQAESLTENVTFLQKFLEGYPSTSNNEGGDLESRILDAANAAQDVIETHIVDSIQNKFSTRGDRMKFGQRLQEVIEDIYLIKNEVVETIEKMGVQDKQPQMKSTSSSGGETQNIAVHRNSTSSSMVGFDDVLYEILDKLTRGGLDRQIIPIVGMGGMGKTTLARTVYIHPLIVEQFDILAWATISQAYDSQNILNEILSQARNSSEKNEPNIGLYKYLFGRKYLIVMDDMWSIQAWGKINNFFPDNNNGSRVVVTTRLSNLACRLSNSNSLNMRFLDFDESWNLFSQIVFPRDGYAPEMVEIGKKIVRNCRGLPLSIVVVGGFLAKLEYEREYWVHIEENLNSVVNSEDDEHCLKILQLSYNQLPVHLKPCFLYMGVFKEDCEISFSELVKLWIAEGFLRPIKDKVLEEVAKEYLKDLVGRNLILIVKRTKKYAKIHDLLRDFCLRQAEAERFYSVVTKRNRSIPFNPRRFVISEAALEKEVSDAALLSTPLARSVIYNFRGAHPSPSLKLLRVYGACDDSFRDYYFDDYSPTNIFQLVNLRYLSVACLRGSLTSLHRLWSLQTLILHTGSFNAPDIWNMLHLRHVDVKGCIFIPDPPICSGQDAIILDNLQTFKKVGNLNFGEEVVKRIPNVKKLGLCYTVELEESCLSNFDRLHKLTSFSFVLYFYGRGSDLRKLSLPDSLKKLSLESRRARWEYILEKIGSLPLLEKLTLIDGSFTTRTWETFEGQFRSLKFLQITNCDTLEYWNSECSHFPRLEVLVLKDLGGLRDIPSAFGEIPTLQKIQMFKCSKSAAISCKMIREEQELYEEDEALRVQISLRACEGVEKFESPNFKFIK